jgi:hypothetical protein
MTLLSSFSTRVASVGVLLSIVSAAPAAVTIQELFDNSALNVSLDGQGAGLTSSTGFAGGSAWAVNAGGAVMSTANNFNVVSGAPDTIPGLSPQATGPGGIWVNTGGNWSTNIFATRQLATPIDLNSPQTIYFSFRINNTGDTGLGVGLASGSSITSNFIGAGGHWNNQADLVGGSAANSLYMTGGLLNQDLAGNNDGPYAALVHTTAGTLNGRALIVGRLTLGVAGDQIDLKQYDPGSAIDANPGAVSWSLSTPFNETWTATHLLLWANGSGNGELDAVRFGNTWLDVTGVPEPGSAALTLLAGAFLAARRRRA